MSLYSERLAHLKKELSIIQKQKKKGFKKNQKIMLDFINGKTNTANFVVKEVNILLRKGNVAHGFMHILLKHYKVGDLEAMDILNMAEVVERGIVLANEGVSKDDNIVYMFLKSRKDFRLILSPNKDNDLVISMYRKSL